MTTQDTIREYFNCLIEKRGWEAFLAEDMIFTSFTDPAQHIKGKEAYLAATRRFFAMVVSLELRDLIVEGSKGCALTHYELQPPTGRAFGSDVVEIFAVEDGVIVSFAIYFDTAPFPQPDDLDTQAEFPGQTGLDESPSHDWSSPWRLMML